jgi:hypothetical protein
MTNEAGPLVVHRYWITDERTGKRRLTSWRMTADDALERYGEDATLEPSTREERHQSEYSKRVAPTREAPSPSPKE